jgi:hypothetical protein
MALTVSPIASVTTLPFLVLNPSPSIILTNNLVQKVTMNPPVVKTIIEPTPMVSLNPNE